MLISDSQITDETPLSRSEPEGLDSIEAERRLLEDGPNDLVAKRHRPWWLDLAALLANPLCLILLAAGAISALVGQILDACLIGSMVLVGTAIDFFQTYRSQVAMDRLRSTVASTATVQRNGRWVEIPRNQIVRGDLIRLSAGDLVPADALLCDVSNLYVQEANLTGESLPVAKTATAGTSATATASTAVYMGTSIVSGSATAQVTATGPRTAFGDIAAKLTEQPAATAFDIGLKRFGYLITNVVFALVLFVLLMNLGLHHRPLQSLLFAVALAVGLTPEFLPMITGVTLSKGAVAMARRHVVVKHLSAIQNLGGIDVLCCDKTGTLTAGTMTLEASLGPDGAPSQRPLELAGINSHFQSGLKSPLDTAILALAKLQQSCEISGEIPFDFERRRLSVVVVLDGQEILICKGSPESVMTLSTTIETAGTIRPMIPGVASSIEAIYASLGRKGMRVLAVGYRPVEKKRQYLPSDEHDLTFAGFLAFSDPIRPDTPDTVAKLQRDGITIKILSGDNDLVTANICAKAGLDSSRIVLGSEIEQMTPSQLAQQVEDNHTFARLTPAQKLRVIETLRLRGHTVGYIGDGVNDAPSLHAADVGIAAPGAVDIAQDSADVVLLEPGLQVLHDGILEGRKAFGNVMKYLLMGTSSNFGNVLSMAIASIALPFLPMLPTQVLLNNFLYDLSQLTIPTDNVDSEYMRHPQRWDIGTIRLFMLSVGPVSSIFDFLTFFVLLKVFHSSEAGFHTGWFVESLITQTLVLLLIRTRRSPFRSRPSAGLLTTVLLIIGIGVWLPWSPFGAALGLTHLPISYLGFLFSVTLAYMAAVELVKRLVFRHLTQPKNSGPGLLPV